MEEFINFIASNAENVAYIAVAIGTFIQVSQKSLSKLWKFIVKRRKNKKFIRTNEINQRINRILIELLAKYSYLSPIRILILRLHNGEYFVGNSEQSIMKVSCTHEETTPGVKEVCQEYQNIHTSQLPILLSDLVKNGTHLILDKDYNIYKTDEHLKSKHFKHGTHSSVNVAILDSSSHLIGFLSMEFDDDKREKEILENVEKLIKETKNIEYLLNSI